MNPLVTIAKAILLATLLLAFAFLQGRAEITAYRRAAEIDTHTDSWSNIIEPTHLSRELNDIDPTGW
jgi:hypothetical protein